LTRVDCGTKQYSRYRALHWNLVIKCCTGYNFAIFVFPEKGGLLKAVPFIIFMYPLDHMTRRD